LPELIESVADLAGETTRCLEISSSNPKRIAARAGLRAPFRAAENEPSLLQLAVRSAVSYRFWYFGRVAARAMSSVALLARPRRRPANRPRIAMSLGRHFQRHRTAEAATTDRRSFSFVGLMAEKGQNRTCRPIDPQLMSRTLAMHPKPSNAYFAGDVRTLPVS